MPKLKTTPPVCRAYPPLRESRIGYFVTRGTATLYSGSSPHVARLLVNTMVGARAE